MKRALRNRGTVLSRGHQDPTQLGRGIDARWHGPLQLPPHIRFGVQSGQRARAFSQECSELDEDGAKRVRVKIIGHYEVTSVFAEALGTGYEEL